MGRKQNSNQHYILDQIQKTISVITEQKTKTWDDLWEIAYQWCVKNYEHHYTEAKAWGVTPGTLLHTALLYVEHPLLVGDGRSWLYTPMQAQAEIIWCEVNKQNVAIPIKSTNSIHNPNSMNPETVEKIEKQG